MTEEKLEKFYKKVRIIIFAIPAIVVLAGLYLALFPVDSYYYYSNNQKLSKFGIDKNIDSNNLYFGIFPARSYRYINLSLNLKKSEKRNCQPSEAEVALDRTYRAFLLPVGDPIDNEQQLHDFLFDSNKTKYPNGSLLHLKPTNEVFLISRGKKILFPGPEIFTAFGYSFDDLVEVEQSDIDQFPDADDKVFLWSMMHPDGTTFQAYPSHSLFLVFDGKRHPISSKDLLNQIWAENFTIPVGDYRPDESLKCSIEDEASNIDCRFDSSLISSTGRYYFFTVKFPDQCQIENVHPDRARITFSSEKSMATVKDSLKTIVASILNRYFYKQ
jgi:hypothetical protein